MAKNFEPPTAERMQRVLEQAAATRGRIDAAVGARDQAIAEAYNKIAQDAHSYPAEMRQEIVRRLREEARSRAERDFKDGMLKDAQVLLDFGEELRAGEAYVAHPIANLDRATLLHPGRATASQTLASAGPAQLRSALERAEELRATDPDGARALAAAAIVRLQELNIPAEKRPFSAHEVARRFEPPGVAKAKELLATARIAVSSGLATWRGPGASSLEKISRGLSGEGRKGETPPAGERKPPTATEKVSAGLAAREAK